MDTLLILFTVTICLNIIILVRIFFSPKNSADGDFRSLEAKMDDFNRSLRAEFTGNRNEYARNFQELRREIGDIFNRFTVTTDQRMENLQISTLRNLKENRDELTASLNAFDVRSTRTLSEMTRSMADRLESIRGEVDRKLASIQADNNQKLEQMRQTVDEKLQSTLERRLGESFRLVSDRLESVQKGLGEMQTLASGVGDLKKILSNAKAKGVIGEYQLEALLEQIMTPQQYGKNVRTKEGSRDSVEFAVKIPEKATAEGHIWLPIDAKFPTEDYERLLSAYDSGERGLIDESVKSLAARIERFARDIREKYVDPPHTTDFAVMFLPFEGLYAEVLRIPGLFEKIQNTHRITITGPTTISALLNSLQMGFRTLAIEKRSVEVWQVLGAVKSEFSKFGLIIEQARKKLDAARDELEKTETRTRKINSRLRAVEELPVPEAPAVSGLDSFIDDDNTD
jgi:DNA recombination protein RmuC